MKSRRSWGMFVRCFDVEPNQHCRVSWSRCGEIKGQIQCILYIDLHILPSQLEPVCQSAGSLLWRRYPAVKLACYRGDNLI